MRVFPRSLGNGFEQFSLAAGEWPGRTGWQRPEFERAEPGAHEPEHFESQCFAQPAHLAILSLADRDRELPQAIAHGVRLDVVRLHEAIVELDALLRRH